MATVKIEVVAGTTMTRLRTITGPDLIRFIAAYRLYASIDPAQTDTQVLETWADNVFQQAQNITRSTEQSAAAAAIVNIGLT
jgi:hypothetical protein